MVLLTYLGFDLEHKVKKYIQMFSKFYCSLPRALFVGWSPKLKVHKANFKTILSYLVRFSTDTVNSNNIFFLLFFSGFFYFSIFFSFFCFLCICFFLFETYNIYSDKHSAMRLGKWWKNFHSADFRKQDYFFLASFIYDKF